ncbi:MAG: TIGR03667 family PPOX class F420-dependent oxidoreductase [Chloroflexota bacterium]|nr:MAG: TIGR03667 family PPOX class F420-dependent oxidoreductase [Chloroflexota bacterium]
MIDSSTEFGARVLRRLAEEEVIWLVTVGKSGTPHPNPVWFLWDGSELLVYSQPNKTKLRDIERNGRVALHFNTAPDGDDVVVIAGDARIDPSAPPADRVEAYLEKYRAGIGRIGMTPESFAASYSVAIRITPTKVRGF